MADWLLDSCIRGHPLRLWAVPRHDNPLWYDCEGCRLENRERGPGPYEPDDGVIKRVVSGDRPPYVHRSEMFQAVKILTERGYSTRRTAETAGVTERTVTRIRGKIKRGIPYGQTRS